MKNEQTHECYLVLGPTLSVADVRSHNPLCFLTQHWEAFQLKTHHAAYRSLHRLTFHTSLLLVFQLEFHSKSTWTTLVEHWRTVLISSWMTMSTHLTQGPFSFMICFFTMASNAMSGVKSPVLKHTKRKGKRI